MKHLLTHKVQYLLGIQFLLNNKQEEKQSKPSGGEIIAASVISLAKAPNGINKVVCLSNCPAPQAFLLVGRLLLGLIMISQFQGVNQFEIDEA